MIHVVAMKCLIGLPLLSFQLLSFHEGVGVLKIKESESELQVLKIEESKLELLCTDSTALIKSLKTIAQNHI
jgi:hypothetical protein